MKKRKNGKARCNADGEIIYNGFLKAPDKGLLLEEFPGLAILENGRRTILVPPEGMSCQEFLLELEETGVFSHIRRKIIAAPRQFDIRHFRITPGVEQFLRLPAAPPTPS